MLKSAKLLLKEESRARLEKIVTFVRSQVEACAQNKSFISLCVYVEDIEKATDLKRVTFDEIKKAARTCGTKKVTTTPYAANSMTEYSTSAFIACNPREQKRRR